MLLRKIKKKNLKQIKLYNLTKFYCILKFNLTWFETNELVFFTK